MKFWFLFAALLLPSAFVFAVPGSIFGDEVAFKRWAAVILPLQAFVTLAAPYVLARRLAAGPAEDNAGFPVVPHWVVGREMRSEVDVDQPNVALPDWLTSTERAQTGQAGSGRCPIGDKDRTSGDTTR